MENNNVTEGRVGERYGIVGTKSRTERYLALCHADEKITVTITNLVVGHQIIVAQLFFQILAPMGNTFG